MTLQTLVFFLFLSAVTVGAQAPSAVLQFSLDRSGPPVTQYTLTLNGEGSGLYTPHLPAGGPLGLEASTGGDSREIRVSPVMAKKLFAAVPMVEGGRCETHNKNIAKTGVKVLHYQGAGHDAQCTYNFSDDDRVNDATAAFEGIAATLQFGDRLRSKLRFDRLGLDGELDSLQSEVAGGRALEVGNIAPVLQAITADERVMDHARRRAEQLLQGVAPPQPSSAMSPSASSSAEGTSSR